MIISWILHKLFSVKTLTHAIALSEDVVRVSVITGEDLKDMGSLIEERLNERPNHVH